MVVERKLMSVTVTEVLGEFDHSIEFLDDDLFLIIYGPNGIGKTRFLQVIEALCNCTTQFFQLASIPFKTATLKFSDGSQLIARRHSSETEPRSGNADQIYSDERYAPKLSIELIRPEEESVVWTPELTPEFESWLSFSTPYERIPENMNYWRDPSDGEVLHISELRRRYRSSPRFRRDLQKGDFVGEDMYPIIKEFIQSVKVRMIDTQRLISKELIRDTDRVRGASEKETHTIVRHSEQIRRELDTNLKANSRLTQRLDSTFPRRMLDRGDRSSITQDELRVKWQDQTKLRERLTKIADLGVDSGLTLPENELNPFQLSMLELYLEDADEKLNSFQQILEKINLLEEIINSRLVRKQLKINAEKGILVIRNIDESQLDLISLSSGEQHEIILIFDLLFNVEKDSIVLIDEPEISLHIGWQQQFIQDVRRIAQLVGFQFIVATHSPQIIGKWWNHAQRLGSAADDFNGEDA